MDRSKTIAPAAAALGLGGLAWAAWHCFFPVAGVAAVGTTNEAKLLAARRGLAQLPVWRRLTISGVKVPSGVSDMPQDLDETMRGASNRACAALAATPTAAIGVGLESGIFRAGGHTFDVCCCCIRVRETQTDSFGFGSSWQMPASVAERLEDPSVTLDVAWETLVSDADPTGQGLLGQLSGGVTTRSTCERTLKSETRLVSVVSSGNASGPPDRLLAGVGFLGRNWS
jgi:non-canonical (house-cleaning) NTP pyrophosphatase